MKIVSKLLGRKTYTDSKGYKRFTKDDIPEHRKVAETKLGRKLKSGEVVHHIDRNKKNNAPSNLYVFKNQNEHDKAHKVDAKKFGAKASYKGFKK